jgi:hypothetical protein
MQYNTVYTHKHNAIYNVNAFVKYKYDESDVLRVLVRKERVYVVCCGELGEITSKCANLLPVFAKVLAALGLHNCKQLHTGNYGTKDGGTFVVFAR